MVTTRIEKAQKLISRFDVDALLIENPVDLFYLTGLSLSLGRLIVAKSHVTLFVDGRYIENARRSSPCKTELLNLFSQSLTPFNRIGFDSSFVSYDGYLELKKMAPSKEFVPIAMPLKTLRMKKEKTEILALQRAAEVTQLGFKHIASLLQEGISEEELALEFEFFCRHKKAERLSFPSIVAFGENSAFPHHRAGKTVLRRDQIVLMDLGAVVDGYAGDMTRVVFFGQPDLQLKKDAELIRKVQRDAISMIRPGILFKELDDKVRSELDKHGCGSLFTHGLSHGIGLETHESPRLKIEGGDRDLVLESGMVFTVEPGIYRPGLGGVRHEDVVVVTDTGYQILGLIDLLRN